MSDNTSVKFLMILNDIAWFWSHRLPLADDILKKGWQLHLATNKAESDPTLAKMGVKGCALPKAGRGSDVIGQLALMWAIYKAIKKVRPTIIHTITIRYAFYTGMVTRLIGYFPVTFTVAGLGSLYTAPGIKAKILRFIAIPLLKFAFGGKGKFVIFQNPDDQKVMVDANIIDIDRTTVIRGSGVNLKEFPYMPYVKTSEPPIILFTSRLLREKGITDFIEAARLLRKKGVKARFAVAGNVYPDNARSLTKEEMQTYHDEGVIEWLGQCDDMPDLLARSMMVVLPSYYGEGVPKVLLEAAAVGRPIISCDAPGCREAVEHQINGELVLPKCPEDLAGAIEKLIQDPELCQAYGIAGRKRVEEDFHVGAVNAQTIKVYEDLLEEAHLESLRG